MSKNLRERVLSTLRLSITATRFSSINLRMKIALGFVLCFALAAVAATITGAAKRSATESLSVNIAASPVSPSAAAAVAVAVAAPAPENCTEPGLLILSDPTGDATGGQPAHDIERLSIAEPGGVGAGKIMFLLKMASLSGTLPPDTYWPVQFRVGGLDYVARMSTFPPATPAAPVALRHLPPPSRLVRPTDPRIRCGDRDDC